MNTENNISEANLNAFLKDFDLELTFVSQDKRYRLVYSTAIVAKDVENPTKLTRTYFLVDEHSKSTIVSPWDTYDESKQFRLVLNLLRYSKYQLFSVAKGWQIKCQNCGSVIEGRIWRNPPKNCENTSVNTGCGSPLNDTNKSMIYDAVRS
jgi:hypothetical protein